MLTVVNVKVAHTKDSIICKRLSASSLPGLDLEGPLPLVIELVHILIEC